MTITKNSICSKSTRGGPQRAVQLFTSSVVSCQVPDRAVITSATDNHGSAAFFHYCDQGDMAHKIDIQEKRNFLLRKAAFGSKETAEEGLRADAANCYDELSAVIQS